MTSFKTWTWRSLAVLAVTLLAACSDGGGGTELVVPPAGVVPTLAAGPADTTVAWGASATFTVSVAAGTAPLAYQWRRNGDAITGATNASYTTLATTELDSGMRFTVAVSNAVGNVVSPAATLTVTPRPLAPTITSQPLGAIVNEGQSTTFTVQASSNNSALSYQWQRNGSDLASATSDSYTTAATTAADEAAQFTVAVINNAGTTLSAVAVLTVRTPPRITAQPQAVSTFTGQTASYSVTATGSGPLQYQWQRNGSAIAGATANSYTTPALALADSGANFSVAISNVAGQAQSSAAALTVTSPPVPPSITTQPQDLTVLSGRTASFVAAAAGSATLNYQWLRNGAAISGANQPSYTTPALAWTDTLGNYSVVVSNSSGTATSRTATLTVTPRVVEVGVGGAMGTARKEDGTVWGWGRSNFLNNVLGNGDTPVAYGTMVRAMNTNGSLFNGVVQISSGVQHTLALKGDGTLWAWGDNSEGSIGIGTVGGTAPYPAQVRDSAGNAFVGVAAVSGGWRFSLALKADGSAWGWGYALGGRLGNNNDPNVVGSQQRFPNPVAVLAPSGSQLSGVTQIVGSSDNGMARRNDGTVWIWGSDQQGQMGNGPGFSGALVAQRLNDSLGAAISGVRQVTLGYFHAAVLLNDGTAMAWGNNSAGQLGDGTFGFNRESPVFVKDAAGNLFGGIASVRAGAACTVFLRNDGTVWVVGGNSRGELARSTAATAVASPVQVLFADGSPLTGVTQIAIFDSTVIVLRNDGTVWGWGDNADGELGFAPTNAVQLSSVPVKISVSGD